MNSGCFNLLSELGDSIDDRKKPLAYSTGNMRVLLGFNRKSKLSILTRPRPKYPPDKYMCMTKTLSPRTTTTKPPWRDYERGDYSEFVRLLHRDTEVNQQQRKWESSKRPIFFIFALYDTVRPGKAEVAGN